jgi:hypothetical protein
MRTAAGTDGQFNPYGLHSVHIPLCMVPYPRLSWAAKCLYARLALFRGRKKDGFCAPDLKKLATAMGASVDAVNRWMVELMNEGFIGRRRRGPGRAAECIFLEHSVFLDSGKVRNQQEATDSAEMPNQEGVLIPQICGSDSAEMPNVDSAEMPNPYKEENIHSENIHKNIHSSSVEIVGTSEAANDDESPFSQNGKTEDLEALVDIARDQLQMARAEDLGIRLEQVQRPDRTIAERILGAFSDYADFEFWLRSTISRSLARKAKSATWGLYATDAANQAEDAARERTAADQRQAAAEAAAQREREAEAEAVRIMNTPMPLSEAVTHIQRSIPEVLRAKLQRTGELVSPNGLLALARAWKRCAECDDLGTVGSAIDSTLAFCGCAAGIEASYRDGGDWPARETARVHADAKSLLIAGAEAISRCSFLAIQIAESVVEDDGATLVIRAPNETSRRMLQVDHRAIEKALVRIGWEREVRVTRSEAA